MIALHTYFNSSAAYRVRIALNLKGLDWTHIGVNVRTGDHHGAEYRALNPNGLVPTLQDGEMTLSQSLAIIDYLDRRYPDPPLVPVDPFGRARVLEMAMIVACDIHPINNLRVLKYLTGPLGLDETRKQEWIHHWIDAGFTALETMLPDHDGWCWGDAPSLADCCLIPQVANAERVQFDVRAFPRIARIADCCRANAAFAAAAPTRQPDYQS